MEFEDFYELAEYGNLNWKGSYTHKEVACNAHTYTMEWEESKRTGKYTDTITELIRLLKEDGTEECLEWLRRMEL